MIVLSFLTMLLLALVLFISKRGKIKEKIFGLCYFYIYFNLFSLMYYERTGKTVVLNFMNIADLIYLLFFLFALKYLVEGER